MLIYMGFPGKGKRTGRLQYQNSFPRGILGWRCMWMALTPTGTVGSWDPVQLQPELKGSLHFCPCAACRAQNSLRPALTLGANPPWPSCALSVMGFSPDGVCASPHPPTP